MTTVQPPDATANNGRQAELHAARLLLDRTGISPPTRSPRPGPGTWCPRSASTSLGSGRLSARAPGGCTARTGTGSSSAGPTDASTRSAPPISGSSWSRRRRTSLPLRQPDHPTARFYPSITATPADGDPVPEVLRFAHAHLDQLAGQVSTRLVRTNEAARCTFLAPAIRAAAQRAPGPLALLEVGASAGLNLLLNRYGYRNRRSGRVLAELPGAPVLDCALDGPRVPPHRVALNVVWRSGIDLNPLDVDDPVDRRWLRALIWPDHRARAVRLEAALQVATTHTLRPVVHAGDASELLPAGRRGARVRAPDRLPLRCARPHGRR
jgi:hypothetical protein